MKQLISLLILTLCLPLSGLAEIAEPDGYKGEPYRGEVPATLEGATVINTAEAQMYWETDYVFIDVLPHAPKPDNLPEGTIWREKPRNSIPNAIWLPNTGYEALADVTMAYFSAGLSYATDGDINRPLVFFCLSECWMSWNAAKRAMQIGYKNVHWYPEGTDGWESEGYPLEVLEPFVIAN